MIWFFRWYHTVKTSTLTMHYSEPVWLGVDQFQTFFWARHFSEVVGQLFIVTQHAHTKAGTGKPCSVVIWSVCFWLWWYVRCSPTAEHVFGSAEVYLSCCQLMPKYGVIVAVCNYGCNLQSIIMNNVKKVTSYQVLRSRCKLFWIVSGVQMFHHV